MSMDKELSLINALTYQLPGSITRPLYMEYKSRMEEIERIWKTGNTAYIELREYRSAVDALMAVSLFYRYVFGHIHGASSFYKMVNPISRQGKECAIKVGNSVIDKEQQGHLQAAVIAFEKIQRKFQLAPAFYEFSETVQFLRNCNELLKAKEYENDDTI